MPPSFLWLAAALMAAFTSWVLKRGSGMSTLNDAGVMIFLLSSMAVMFLSAVLYLYSPGFTNLVVLLAFNMVTMGVFLIPILFTVFFGDRKLEVVGQGARVKARTVIVGGALAFALMSEVFMAWTFSVLSGAVRAVGGPGAVYAALVSSASSYWFVFTMAAEMGLTFTILRARFEGGMKWVIGSQAAMMLLSPTAISGGAWVDVSFASTCVIMVGIFAYSLVYFRRTPGLNTATVGYIGCLAGAYSAMMGGLVVWFLDGDALIFVLSILFQMAVYFYVVLEEKRLGVLAEPAAERGGALAF